MLEVGIKTPSITEKIYMNVVLGLIGKLDSNLGMSMTLWSEILLAFVIDASALFSSS